MSERISGTAPPREVDRHRDEDPPKPAPTRPEKRLEAAFDLASRYSPPAVVLTSKGSTSLPDVGGIVHPERQFTSMAPLQNEVMRLRAELAKSSDATLQAALRMRIGQLSQRFKDSVLEEWALRTPGMLERIIAANKNDPRLVPLIEADLRRRGDRAPCRPDATVPELMARRVGLVAADARVRQEEDARRKAIGVDGRIAPAEDLSGYEAQQYLLAMNPGTTMGGLLATVAASRGGDVDDLRVAGKAGNHIQEFSGGLAPKGLKTTGIGGQTTDVQTAPMRPR